MNYVIHQKLLVFYFQNKYNEMVVQVAAKRPRIVNIIIKSFCDEHGVK